MKTFNPTSGLHGLTHPIKMWVQSVHKVLNGSVDMGTPTKSHPVDASVNSGVYTQFDKGNSSGILVRVAGNGAFGSNAPYNWPAVGGLAIDHQLGRQPIGFIVVDSDKDVRVFRTVAPTANLLTVAPTDRSAAVTLYIF